MGILDRAKLPRDVNPHLVGFCKSNGSPVPEPWSRTGLPPKYTSIQPHGAEQTKEVISPGLGGDGLPSLGCTKVFLPALKLPDCFGSNLEIRGLVVFFQLSGLASSSSSNESALCLPPAVDNKVWVTDGGRSLKE